jgi:hypothetical protein
VQRIGVLVRLLERLDLDCDVVHRERGDLLLVHPLDAVTAEAGRSDRPELGLLIQRVPPGHVPGPHEQDVAGPHFDPVRPRRAVEVVGGDRRARLQPLDPLDAAEVEQHAATDQGVRELVDAAAAGTGERLDVADPEAVVHGVVVEEVGKAVPLGAPLQRHEQVVVGALEVREELVRPGPGHEVRARVAVHVHDPRSRRVHRAGGVQPDRAADRGPALDQRGSRGHPLGSDEVDGAALVELPPAAPVVGLRVFT